MDRVKIDEEMPRLHYEFRYIISKALITFIKIKNSNKF